MEKYIRTWNIQRIIYNFRSSYVLHNILIKSFLIRVLYYCYKLTYAYLNEGDKVCECYSCFKIVMQAHLHVGFFAIFFIERVLLKRFYLSLKLLQSKTIFRQKGNHEVSSH